MKRIISCAVLVALALSLNAQRIDTTNRPKKVTEKIVFAKHQKVTQDRVIFFTKKRPLVLVPPRTEQYAWVVRRYRN